MARSIKRIILALGSILLIAYLIWEIYWYDQVGIGFISWHTHLMIYVYLGLLMWMLSRFFRSGQVANVFLAAYTVLIVLFMIEGMLIIAKRKETYPDNSFEHYFSYYNARHASYYHTWPPSRVHYLKKYEYSYARQTNSLGFADREWSISEKTKLRVMTLGDSFTEGDGAPQDSSYPMQLATIVNKNSQQYEIMNAGICGSDPFFDYINFKDRLYKYKPDILLQSLSAGDVLTDMATKGGLERFIHKPSITFKQGPWWEPIYAISHISRMVFSALGYNNMLVKGDLTTQQKEVCNKQLTDLFISYDSLASAHNAKLYILLRPNTINDITKSRTDYDFDPVLRPLAQRNHIVIIDLIPLYREYITRTGIDPQTLFWPLDGHHNSAGYHVMAELIAQAVFASDSIDTRSTAVTQ